MALDEDEITKAYKKQTTTGWWSSIDHVLVTYTKQMLDESAESEDEPKYSNESGEEKNSSQSEMDLRD